MTSLFIGGCADGHWLPHADDATHWQVAKPSPPPTVDDCTIQSMFNGCDTYRRERLGAPGKTWTVFVHEPLSMTEAMDKLLEGYKP